MSLVRSLESGGVQGQIFPYIPPDSQLLTPFVSKVRRQPPLRFRYRPSLPPSVVSDLIPSDLSNAEIDRLGAPEIPAAHRGGREHREALGDRHPGGAFGIEEAPDDPLLGVVGAGGKAPAGAGPPGLLAG